MQLAVMRQQDEAARAVIEAEEAERQRITEVERQNREQQEAQGQRNAELVRQRQEEEDEQQRKPELQRQYREEQVSRVSGDGFWYSGQVSVPGVRVVLDDPSDTVG